MSTNDVAHRQNKKVLRQDHTRDMMKMVLAGRLLPLAHWLMGHQMQTTTGISWHDLRINVAAGSTERDMGKGVLY